MLFNRRQALINIGLAAGHGAAAWSLPQPLRSFLREDASPSSETPADNTVDARLREDLARLAPRAYSEEGVPMFLACVNLVPASPSHPEAKVMLNALSADLAAALRRNAEAYQRLRPHATAHDIAPLIEVLAYRDFTQGETARQS